MKLIVEVYPGVEGREGFFVGPFNSRALAAAYAVNHFGWSSTLTQVRWRIRSLEPPMEDR